MWPKKCMMWDFIYLLVTQSSTSAIFYFHCSCHCRLLSSLLLHCAVYGLKEETTWKLENMHCIALHWPNHFCKCWAAISEDECVRENDIQVIVITFSKSSSTKQIIAIDFNHCHQQSGRRVCQGGLQKSSKKIITIIIIIIKIMITIIISNRGEECAREIAKGCCPFPISWAVAKR